MTAAHGIATKVADHGSAMRASQTGLGRKGFAAHYAAGGSRRRRLHQATATAAAPATTNSSEMPTASKLVVVTGGGGGGGGGRAETLTVTFARATAPYESRTTISYE